MTLRLPTAWVILVVLVAPPVWQPEAPAPVVNRARLLVVGSRLERLEEQPRAWQKKKRLETWHFFVRFHTVCSWCFHISVFMFWNPISKNDVGRDSIFVFRKGRSESGQQESWETLMIEVCTAVHSNISMEFVASKRPRFTFYDCMNPFKLTWHVCRPPCFSSLQNFKQSLSPNSGSSRAGSGGGDATRIEPGLPG